jgi:hypothetical protein
MLQHADITQKTTVVAAMLAFRSMANADAEDLRMSIAKVSTRAASCDGETELPGDLREGLLRHFSQRRMRYVARVLSTAELQVTDLRDALTIARIKRMSPQRLKRFDEFVPVSAEQHRNYQLAQMEWIRGEHHLLSARLGRNPTHAELSADFSANRNGLRFRAFYVMKHPERMRRIERRDIGGRVGVVS